MPPGVMSHHGDTGNWASHMEGRGGGWKRLITFYDASILPSLYNILSYTSVNS